MACQFPGYALINGATEGAGAAGASEVGAAPAGGFGFAGATGAGSNSTGGGSDAAGGNGATGGTSAAGEDAGGGTTLGGGGMSAGGSESNTGGSPIGGGGAGGAGAGGTSDSGGQGGHAGAGGGPLFWDDFESGTAAQWLAVAGTSWAVVDAGEQGKAYAQDPTFSDFYAAIATTGSWSDQIIEAKVKVLAFGGSSTSDVVTVFGRFANLDNYYAAVLRPDGRVAIRARVGGVPPAALDTSTSFGITTGVWYQLRFELVGSSLKLFVDGTLRAEVLDDRLTQGSVAVGGDNTAGMFDAVRVTRPE